MKFSTCAPLFDSMGEYSSWLCSENRKWVVVNRNMIFGTRIAIFPHPSSGPTLDYCCGSDPVLLALVKTAVVRILEPFSESSTERDILRHFPGFTVKPIHRDPKCLPRLMALAGMELQPGIHKPDPFACQDG